MNSRRTHRFPGAKAQPILNPVDGRPFSVKNHEANANESLSRISMDPSFLVTNAQDARELKRSTAEFINAFVRKSENSPRSQHHGSPARTPDSMRLDFENDIIVANQRESQPDFSKTQAQFGQEMFKPNIVMSNNYIPRSRTAMGGSVPESIKKAVNPSVRPQSSRKEMQKPVQAPRLPRDHPRPVASQVGQRPSRGASTRSEYTTVQRPQQLDSSQAHLALVTSMSNDLRDRTGPADVRQLEAQKQSSSGYINHNNGNGEGLPDLNQLNSGRDRSKWKDLNRHQSLQDLKAIQNDINQVQAQLENMDLHKVISPLKSGDRKSPLPQSMEFEKDFEKLYMQHLQDNSAREHQQQAAMTEPHRPEQLPPRQSVKSRPPKETYFSPDFDGVEPVKTPFKPKEIQEKESEARPSTVLSQRNLMSARETASQFSVQKSDMHFSRMASEAKRPLVSPQKNMLCNVQNDNNRGTAQMIHNSSVGLSNQEPREVTTPQSTQKQVYQPPCSHLQSNFRSLGSDRLQNVNSFQASSPRQTVGNLAQTLQQSQQDDSLMYTIADDGDDEEKSNFEDPRRSESQGSVNSFIKQKKWLEMQSQSRRAIQVYKQMSDPFVKPELPMAQDFQRVEPQPQDQRPKVENFQVQRVGFQPQKPQAVSASLSSSSRQPAITPLTPTPKPTDSWKPMRMHPDLLRTPAAPSKPVEIGTPTSERLSFGRSIMNTRSPNCNIQTTPSLPQEVHDKILRKYHHGGAQVGEHKQLPVFKISLFSKQTNPLNQTPQLTRQVNERSEMPPASQNQPRQSHMRSSQKAHPTSRVSSGLNTSTEQLVKVNQRFGSRLESYNSRGLGSQSSGKWDEQASVKSHGQYRPPADVVSDKPQRSLVKFPNPQGYMTDRPQGSMPSAIPRSSGAYSNYTFDRQAPPTKSATQFKKQSHHSDGRLSFASFGLEENDSVARSLKAFRSEYLELINSKLQTRGRVFLVEILVRLGFLKLHEESLTEEQMQAIYGFLKTSRYNILIRKGDPVQLLSDDAKVNNLFKVLCAVLNLSMATKGALYLDDAQFEGILAQCSTTTTQDLGSQMIEQLAALCGLVSRPSFCVKSHQVQQIHDCFYTLYENRTKDQQEAPAEAVNQIKPNPDQHQVSRSDVFPVSMQHQVSRNQAMQAQRSEESPSKKQKYEILQPQLMSKQTAEDAEKQVSNADGPFEEKKPKKEKGRKSPKHEEPCETEQLQGSKGESKDKPAEEMSIRGKPPTYQKPPKSQPRESAADQPAPQRPESAQQIRDLATPIPYFEPPCSPQFAKEVAEEPLRMFKQVEKRDMEIQTNPVQKGRESSKKAKESSLGKPKTEAAPKRHSKADFKVKINQEIEQDEIKAKRMQQAQPFQMEILPEEVRFTPPKRQSLKPQFITEAEFNRPHSMAGDADLDHVMIMHSHLPRREPPSRPLTAQMIRPEDFQKRTSAVSPIEEEESKWKIQPSSIQENEPDKCSNVEEILRAAFNGQSRAESTSQQSPLKRASRESKFLGQDQPKQDISDTPVHEVFQLTELDAHESPTLNLVTTSKIQQTPNEALPTSPDRLIELHFSPSRSENPEEEKEAKDQVTTNDIWQLDSERVLMENNQRNLHAGDQGINVKQLFSQTNSKQTSENTSLRFPAVKKPSQNSKPSSDQETFHLKSYGGKDTSTYRPTNSYSSLGNSRLGGLSSNKKLKSKKITNKFKPSAVKNQDKYLLNHERKKVPREIPAAPLTKELICIMKVDLDGGKTSQQLNVYEGQPTDQIVNEFAKKHNLAPSARSKLLKQVEQQVEAYSSQNGDPGYLWQ